MIPRNLQHARVGYSPPRFASALGTGSWRCQGSVARGRSNNGPCGEIFRMVCCDGTGLTCPAQAGGRRYFAVAAGMNRSTSSATCALRSLAESSPMTTATSRLPPVFTEVTML